MYVYVYMQGFLQRVAEQLTTSSLPHQQWQVCTYMYNSPNTTLLHALIVTFVQAFLSFSNAYLGFFFKPLLKMLLWELSSVISMHTYYIVHTYTCMYVQTRTVCMHAHLQYCSSHSKQQASVVWLLVTGRIQTNHDCS